MAKAQECILEKTSFHLKVPDDQFNIIRGPRGNASSQARGVVGMIHQTFQVPKIEVLTYISCMDTAYVRENPSPN